MSMGTAWRVAESMQVGLVGKKSTPPVNCCGVVKSGTLKENAPAASVVVVLFTVPTVKMTCSYQKPLHQQQVLWLSAQPLHLQQPSSVQVAGGAPGRNI